MQIKHDNGFRPLYAELGITVEVIRPDEITLYTNHTELVAYLFWLVS